MAVLLLEGALHQTFVERLLVGNFRNYDVRSILKRIDEASDSNHDSLKITTEQQQKLKAYLAKEFPNEVVQRLDTILTNLLNAKTTEEHKKVAVSLF